MPFSSSCSRRKHRPTWACVPGDASFSGLTGRKAPSVPSGPGSFGGGSVSSRSIDPGTAGTEKCTWKEQCSSCAGVTIT
jgi:hypothetical protein